MDALGSGGQAVAGRRAAAETWPGGQAATGRREAAETGEWREAAGGDWAPGGVKAARSADRADGSPERVDGAGVRQRRSLVRRLAGVAGWWYTHWLRYPAAVGVTRR
jgi:hypothetical protein